jgi:hypothetical protein
VELVAVVGTISVELGVAFGAQDTRNTRMSKETVKTYILDFIPNLLFIRT